MRPAVQVASSTIFLHKVAVGTHAGQHYRLTMRAQADTAGGSWASLGVVYLKSGRHQGNVDLYNQKKPLNRVRSTRWETYTISGTLPKQVDTLLITPNVNLNGRFAFDDFRLEAKLSTGAWQTVPIANGDFETPALSDSSATMLPTSWQHYTGPVAGYTYRVAREASGNHYLLVRGTAVVAYGDNRVAGHYQKVNGVKIYYETYGQGPPLLLLHGNGESIKSFRHQIASLARHYRVIAVDTRDHGHSAATKDLLTYDLFADDMVALLDALHVPSAHVLGWSDGGNTGLSLALRYPARIRSLAAMGANITADTTAVPGSFFGYVQQASRSGPVRSQRLNALMANYPQMPTQKLATIHTPVLILAGEKDIIKEAHTRLIAASIPGAQLHILPGLTHYAPQENPGAFNEVVLKFLQSQP